MPNTVPVGVRAVAAVIAGVSGIVLGLASLAVSAVVDDRRAGTVGALVAVLGTAGLFAALALALGGTIRERDGRVPYLLVIVASAAAAVAAVLSMLRLSGVATTVAATAALVAVGVGYAVPSARDQEDVTGRRRMLADALGPPSGRLPEPWLVLAAREAAAEQAAAGLSAALARGLAVVALAAVGLGGLGVVLGTASDGTAPGNVALAVFALAAAVVAAGALGAGIRAALGRARPFAAGRGAGRPAPVRAHSGAVSFRALAVGVETVTLDVAPGEHVGLLLPPGGSGQELAASAAQLVAVGDQHVVHHGVDGRPLGRDDALHQVAVVSPDVTLVAGTLRDNLAFGDPGTDDEQLRQVADAWGLLRSGDQDLDEPLDAGTWQPDALLRLAAARAVLARPAVVVLYDRYAPTASGPTLSAEAVHALGDGRTVIHVSSRRDALGGADFVMRIG